MPRSRCRPHRRWTAGRRCPPSRQGPGSSPGAGTASRPGTPACRSRTTRRRTCGDGRAAGCRRGCTPSLRRASHTLSAPLVQRFQQERETPGLRGVLGDHPRAAFDGGELLHEARLHVARLLEVSAPEAQAHDGLAHRPVPVLVDGQPLEQRLVALEQLLAGVEGTGSCGSGAGGRGSSASPRRAAAGYRRSCPRSSSPPPESCGRSGCRWGVCAVS